MNYHPGGVLNNNYLDIYGNPSFAAVNKRGKDIFIPLSRHLLRQLISFRAFLLHCSPSGGGVLSFPLLILPLFPFNCDLERTRAAARAGAFRLVRSRRFSGRGNLEGISRA